MWLTMCIFWVFSQGSFAYNPEVCDEWFQHNSKPWNGIENCFYEYDFEENYITCRLSTDIGANVDKVIENRWTHSTRVRLIEIAIEDSTLSPGWYNGKSKIFMLEFHSCDISVIKEDAFAQEALNDMKLMAFFRMNQIIQFESNAFRGIKDLRGLEMSCMLLAPLGQKFVWGFEQTLIFFQISGFSQLISIQDLFGWEPLSILYEIEISHNYAMQVLAAENFTMAPRLHELGIIESGIEYIEDGAFDRLLKTLQVICFYDNELLEISPAVFYGLLLHRVRCYCHDRKDISFVLHTPCNCDYFWLKYLIKINLGIFNKESYIKCEEDQNPEPSVQMIETCHLQAINLNKFCLKPADFKLIAFAKFDVDVRMNGNESQLQVKCEMAEPFRIFFIRFEVDKLSNEKCRSPAWLRGNTKCFRIKNNTSDLWIPLAIDQVKFTFVGIHFITRHQMWPLHLVTVRPLDVPTNMVKTYEHLLTIVAIGICVVGLFFGVGLFWCIRKCSSDDEIIEGNKEAKDASIAAYELSDQPAHYESDHGYLNVVGDTNAGAAVYYEDVMNHPGCESHYVEVHNAQNDNAYVTFTKA